MNIFGWINQREKQKHSALEISPEGTKIASVGPYSFLKRVPARRRL